MLSNTHFSIGVHVLCSLAYNEGRHVGSEELAATVGTNASFLRGLIGQLRDAGLVETQLGKGGGTALARPATELTLRDVYRATESKPPVKTHVCDRKSKCVVARGMEDVLSGINDRLETAVDAELGKVTIASLLDSLTEH
ncbi:MAG: Rrf2 family transcriptional regulator [Candidatus Eisenbacteria bacterium]|uniref:Rrf2 family transcriptional regulator n=1 Tax=Eiseniibacteriota bacterium TaxID=2212470 RepID=A0A956NIC5_UNCEI|nr:Rrf2 family transcriptional regulator [Candidatus Eisenbacteria bacterium]MCB9465885.1 Rrf2 family transcriptional regulator [Candidatus Eisenbacteria bacterium]